MSSIVALSLAGIRSSSQIGKVIEATQGLVHETTRMMIATRKANHEAARYAVDAMSLNHERLFHVVERGHASGILAKDGFSPHLLDPQSRVVAEIRAYARHLGVTEEGAIEWIRSQIPAPEVKRAQAS